MSTIDILWLAHLNRNTDDAGSDSTINLSINVDGTDVHDHDYGSNVGDGEAYLNGGAQLETPFDSAALTNAARQRKFLAQDFLKLTRCVVMR